MSYDVQVYIDLAQAKANEYADARAQKGSDMHTALYNCYITAFSWWHGELEHLKAVIKAHKMDADKKVEEQTVTAGDWV